MNKTEKALYNMAQARLNVERLTLEIGESLSRCKESDVHMGVAYAYIRDDCNNLVFTEHGEQTAEDFLKTECPICLATHNLIQKRKEQRKLLGIAKTKVTKISRNIYWGRQ